MRKPPGFVAACTLPCRSSSSLPRGALRQKRPTDTEEAHSRVSAAPEEHERCQSSADVVMCGLMGGMHT